MKTIAKHLIGAALVLSLLGIVTESEANLVKVDLTTPGDKQLTYDTSTGLSWLNVSNTTLHSYNEIISGFGGYITSDGFRYATSDEVGILLADYEVPQVPVGSYPTGGSGYYNITSLMWDYLGVTWANYNSRAIVGITAGAHYAYLYSNDYGQWTANQDWGTVDGNYAGYPSTGYEISSFLVKEPTAVPIPATIWLFGSALAGLSVFRRPKKSA